MRYIFNLIRAIFHQIHNLAAIGKNNKLKTLSLFINGFWWWYSDRLHGVILWLQTYFFVLSITWNIKFDVNIISRRWELLWKKVLVHIHFCPQGGITVTKGWSSNWTKYFFFKLNNLDERSLNSYILTVSIHISHVVTSQTHNIKILYLWLSLARVFGPKCLTCPRHLVLNRNDDERTTKPSDSCARENS